MKELMTLMIFFPVLGAIAQTWSPRPAFSRVVALISSLVSAVCGIFLISSLHIKSAEGPIKVVTSWMSSYSINYAVTVDGLNALVVLLICIVFPLLIVAEWHRSNARRGMYGMLLLLQTAILGAVCTQDLFLIFFFWVLIGLPIYFLTGIWGDTDREKVAFKQIVVFTISNSFFFLGILLIYYALEPHTFLVEEITALKLADKNFILFGRELPVQPISLGLISFALALRAPIWPFHGWFKQVSVQLPPTIMIALHLAGLPVALTLFTRLGYGMFPNLILDSAEGIIILGMINLTMGVLSMLAERDLRGVLSYLSLSYAGMALLGIGSASSAGMVGASFQIFTMGLGISGMGFVVEFLYHRKKSYDVDQYGALIKRAPFLGIVCALFLASLLGTPGLVGFVGSSLLFIGQFAIHPFLAVGVSILLIVMTGFLFQVFKKLFLGAASNDENFSEMNLREASYFIPLVVVTVLVGVFPEPLVEIVRPTIVHLIQAMRS